MKSVMQKLRLRPSPRRGKHKQSPESHTAVTEGHTNEDEDDFDNGVPVLHLDPTSKASTPKRHGNNASPRHQSPSHRLRPMNLLRRHKKTPEKSPRHTPSDLPTPTKQRSRRGGKSKRQLPPTTTSNSNRSSPPLRVSVKESYRTPPTPLVTEEADPIVQEALLIGTREHKPLDEEAKQKVSEAVRALDKAGNSLFEKGDYDGAFQRYERALWLKRRALEGKKSPKHKEHLLLQQQVGQQQEPQQQQQKQQPAGASSAEATKPQERSNSESSSGEENSSHTNSVLASVATSINNMTYLRQRSGQATTDETMASYLKSLQIKRDILGPDHLSVGKTLNNIGSVFYLKKEYEAALTAYKDAHRILENHLGEDHLDVGTIVSNMADVHAASGNTTMALEKYRLALVLRWKALGKNDPKVIRLMEQIARLETGKQPILGDESLGEDVEDDVAREQQQVFLDDIQTLQTELSEDMKFFDLMERQMAIDMVRDKTRMFREMHGIAEEEEDEEVDGETHDNDEDLHGDLAGFDLPTLEEGLKHYEEEENTVAEESGDHGAGKHDVEDEIETGNGHKEESEHEDEHYNEHVHDKADPDVEETVADEPDEPTAKGRKRKSSLPEPPAPRLTAQERQKALSSVKTRLERLRAKRAEQLTVPIENRHFMDPTASSAAKASAAAPMVTATPAEVTSA